MSLVSYFVVSHRLFAYPQLTAHSMDELSRRLTRLLRHEAFERQVTRDPEGWASITKVANHIGVTVADIEHCAATSVKDSMHRFEGQYWEDGVGQVDLYIRATWGRSLACDLAARPQKKARPVKTTPTEMPPWNSLACDWCDRVDLAARAQRATPWKRQKIGPANVLIKIPPWKRQTTRPANDVPIRPNTRTAELEAEPPCGVCPWEMSNDKIIVRVAWWREFSACTAADFDTKFVLDIPQGRSIGSIKASIEDLCGIPRDVQHMSFKGRVLQDRCTVENVMVKHGSTVYVVAQMRIFIKTTKNKMIPLNVFLTDRVYKIWGLLCIRVPGMRGLLPRAQDTYRLMFNGIELEDAHRTLNDYNIIDLNELYLERRSMSLFSKAGAIEEFVLQVTP